MIFDGLSLIIIFSCYLWFTTLYIDTKSKVQQPKFYLLSIENCHRKKSWAPNDRKSTWLICHSEQRPAFWTVRIELFSGMRYSGYSFWRLILSKKENFLTIQNFEPGVHFRVIRGLSTQNREITARFKFFDRFNQWDDRVEHFSKESKRISQPKKSVKMTILGIFLLKIEWKKIF